MSYAYDHGFRIGVTGDAFDEGLLRSSDFVAGLKDGRCSPGLGVGSGVSESLYVRPVSGSGSVSFVRRGVPSDASIRAYKRATEGF